MPASYVLHEDADIFLFEDTELTSPTRGGGNSRKPAPNDGPGSGSLGRSFGESDDAQAPEVDATDKPATSGDDAKPDRGDDGGSDPASSDGGTAFSADLDFDEQGVRSEAGSDAQLSVSPSFGGTEEPLEGVDRVSFTVTSDNGYTVSATSSGTVTLQFQHGSDGYLGLVDTYLQEASPTKNQSTAKTLIVDGLDKGGAVQSLIRFDDIFGFGPGQIPLGATILSAMLEVRTTSKGDGALFHRMLTPWGDRDNWNSFGGNGIQADGQEAAVGHDLNTGKIAVGTTLLNVTAGVQAWASGASNYGWALLPLGPDGWKFDSAQGAAPPKLVVEFSYGGGPPPPPPPENQPPVAVGDSAATVQGTAVTIDVLANDFDPDNDPLSVTGLTQPSNGTAIVQGGLITYTPSANFTGTDSFTYRAWDGSLQSDPATVQVTVNPIVYNPPVPLDASYIATLVGSNTDKRNMEHTNATKSFYHDGDWWSVLPNQAGWHVHRFDGPLPEPGTLGGWTAASSAMLSPGRRADIAWDAATETLFVLNFGPSETTPRLYKLGYNEAARTFAIEDNIQLAGTNGKLTGAEWQRNAEMSLAIDQNGNPLVALVGPSAAGGEKGLKLAYPTSPNLSAWATTTVDSGPNTTSGSNGDSKADIVAFRHNGVDHIGIAYSDASTNTWKLAYQPTEASPSGYGSGWQTTTVTSSVNVDNHIAALWDEKSNSIIITMKDDRDALWMVKGLPDAWETPINIHDRSHKASRPTLALDEDAGTVFVFYQENTGRPYGDIHFKMSDTDSLAFDASHPGTRILASTRSGENMADPQMPTHPVGTATDGKFFVFARNWDVPQVWYNDIVLSDPLLVA